MEKKVLDVHLRSKNFDQSTVKIKLFAVDRTDIRLIDTFFLAQRRFSTVYNSWLRANKNRLNLNVVYKTKERDKAYEMSKQEKYSRRSSILKGTKTPNPLQPVEIATSSAEKTPLGLKRRVSFAEKKHVKEFCDSMEQGTVWDNTYEESDSSHVARSHQDENHHSLSHSSTLSPYIPSPNNSDDSSRIFEFSRNHSKNHQKRLSVLELNFVGPHVIEQNPQLLLDKENIPIDPMADLNDTEDNIIYPQNPQEILKESSRRFEIYCDEENSPPVPEKSEKESENSSHDPTVTLTESKCHDLTDDKCEIEMTEAIPSILTAPKNPRQSVFEGMEMTEALPSVLLTMERDKLGIVDQNGMEMTEGIPSTSTNNKPIRKTIFQDENTQIFHQRGMEMTEPISSLRRPQKSVRKSILNPDGMEMTEAIPSLLNVNKSSRKSILTPEDIEMTQAITSVLSPLSPIDDVEKSLNSFPQNARNFLNAKPGDYELFPSVPINHQHGMEMTEPILSVLRPQKPNRKSVINPEGMEMTEAITSVLNSKKSSRKSILNSERMETSENQTQLFYQRGMELTEAIAPSFPNSELQENSQIQGLNNTSEPLEIQNYFMELTEAIPSLKRPYNTILSQNPVDSSFTSPRSKSPKDKSPLPQIIPSKEDREALHRLLHSEPQNLQLSPPNLQNQSMDFTTAITAQFKCQNPGDNVNEFPHDSITEIISPLPSFGQEALEDMNRIGEVRKSLVNSSSPEVESSDSFKENRAPPGEHPRTHPVARPLFEKGDDETSDPTPTPLEDSEDLPESMRAKAAIDGRNLEDLTVELTSVIEKGQELSSNPLGTLSSSDLQNIEAPSFMFADSVSYENSFPKLGNRSDEVIRDSRMESRRNVEEDMIDRNFEAIKFGDQEITCDIRSVPVPEVDFTEEINFEGERRTRVTQNNEDNEEIMKRRRTYNISEVDKNLSEDRRRTHTIRRHEEEEKEVVQRMEKSGTYVINKQLSSSSVEINGEVCVETVDENTVITYESKMADIGGKSLDNVEEQREDNSEESGRDVVLEKKKRICEDHYRVDVVDDEMRVEFDIRERETDSVKLNSGRDQVENGDDEVNNEDDVSSIEESSHRAKIFKEHELIIKRIKKSRKQEEMILQKMVNARDNSRELSSKCGDDLKMMEDKIVRELSAFESMKRNVEEFSRARGCIWKPYQIFEEKVFVEFNKTGFLFGVTFHVPQNEDEIERIKEFYTIGRLNSGEKAILKMTDRLIVDRINQSTANLKMQFKNYDDVLPLVNAVTEDVRFIYNFYEELKRMSYSTLMEIELDRLSFLITTKSSDTILKIFMNIKSFEEIGPEDIEVHCLLGSVRISDIKDLIKNVKRNHKFITLYKNDVKDYIELMEESSMRRLGK